MSSGNQQMKQQEEKNRKMLEELQRQKRQLLMKTARQEEELEKQKKGPPPPMGRDQNQNKQTRVKTYKPPQLAVKPIRKSKSAHSSIANRPSLSMPSTSVGGISGADGKDTTAGSSTPSTSSTSTNPLGSYFATKSATTMSLDSSIMFIPVNSQHGNNIIPVFPRIGADT